MKTLTIELGTISESTNGVTWALDLSKIPEPSDTITALIRQGALIIAQRVKSGEPLKERLEALPKVIAEIEAGTYSFGIGGGRGPSSTVEEAGWVAYFNAKDTPVRFDKEKATKATLDKYLDALTRKAIWPGVAKFLAGKSKEEQITFHKEKLPALIAKHRPGMIATEEARTEDGSPGWYINAERVKRSGKIEKKVTEIEIEIEIE